MGDLLVATVASSQIVVDSEFDQAVVLVLEADDRGAVGVTLNQPWLDRPLEDVLEGWGSLASAPSTLFHGGPVAPEGGLCLARLTDPAESPLGFARLFDDVGLVELDSPLPLVEHRYEDLRVFAGYAGWEAGQLEDELGSGLWHVARARPSDIFSPEPMSLWRTVLRRRSDETAFFATWTPQPHLN